MMVSFKGMCLVVLTVLLLSVSALHAQDAGDVLFEDDFESSKELPGWDWSDNDHDFARVATDGENRALRLIGDEDGAGLFSEDSDDWENYALELRFKIETPTDGTGYDVVLVVRDDVDNNASAGAILSSQNEEVLIATSNDDNYEERGSASYTLNVGEWYSARFVAAGDQLELSLNGEVLVQANSREQGERGGIGVLVGDNAIVLFDDVQVTAVDVENQIAAQFGDEIGALIGNLQDEAQVAASAEVTVNSANLRGGPGTEFDIVGTARRGDTFDIIAQTGEGDDVWYLVDADDEMWIFSGVVQLDPADAEIPDVEDVQP
ncbi:MAG: SH3 domain-containing protein [Anaerolineae bacterium]